MSKNYVVSGGEIVEVALPMGRGTHESVVVSKHGMANVPNAEIYATKAEARKALGGGK